MKHTGLASWVVVISLASAILCAGCTSSTTPSPNAGTATGNATALGAGITVVQGQNFTIQLQSNPSTGYHWEPTYNNSTIALTNRAFASSVSTESNIVGAGGTDVFTFQGTNQGTSVITFNNISPSNQTANSVSYTVVITS
jgi:inhibitor of cysteine peptidase